MKYKTFWNFSSVIRQDYDDYNGKIWKQFENVYRNYNIFITRYIFAEIKFSKEINTTHFRNTISVKNGPIEYLALLTHRRKYESSKWGSDEIFVVQFPRNEVVRPHGFHT